MAQINKCLFLKNHDTVVLKRPCTLSQVKNITHTQRLRWGTRRESAHVINGNRTVMERGTGESSHFSWIRASSARSKRQESLVWQAPGRAWAAGGAGRAKSLRGPRAVAWSRANRGGAGAAVSFHTKENTLNMPQMWDQQSSTLTRDRWVGTELKLTLRATILFHWSEAEFPLQFLLNSYAELCVCQFLSHVWLFVTPWTIARQAPLSMGFSKQEYWSGLPFPPPEELPNPGIEPWLPAS